jgi:hypothetical protein
MRPILIIIALAALGFVGSVGAQDATTQQPSLAVGDQLSLDGFVTIQRVVSPTPGWVALYAGEDDDAYVVGIAPVPAGESLNVRVMFDVLAATPSLTARLHTDDGQLGVFEFGSGSSTDAALAGVEADFTLTAIRVFDQMLAGSTAIIASVIYDGDGWLVIHADNNGQPGAVLGQTGVTDEVSAGVVVSLSGEITPVLWAMLHVDDGAAGTYEFVPGSSADAPVFVNNVLATLPFVTASEPVILSASGLPLPAQVTETPRLTVNDQQPTGSGDQSSVSIAAVVSAGAGWLRVTADEDNHPAAKLGEAEIEAGSSSNVSVTLASSVADLPDAVWVTLHIDDNSAGISDYLRIPGADMPVVVDGRIIAQKITFRSNATPRPVATAEPTADVTAEPTADVTAEPTADVTAEPTADATAEPTADATEPTADVTEAPLPDVTEVVPPPTTQEPPVVSPEAVSS